MTRFAVAAVLTVHGLIHLIGFVVPWRLAEVAGFAYRTTVLDGGVELGATGMRVVGILWLACAVGFLVAALGIARRAPWALPLAATLAGVSLLICLIGLPETSAGVAVNLAILAGAAWAARTRTHTLEMAP